MTLDLNIDQIRGWMAEAGQIALRYFGDVTPEWKGIADPVTEADRAIERLLASRIRGAYPHHGILGEEYGGETLDHRFIWTVDPIDGTRIFVAGLPTWSITIALLEDRVPAFGMVYIPLYDDWTYTDGDDVICNGRPVKGQLQPRWKDDSVVLSRSDAHSWFEMAFTRVVGLGSTATHFAYTARGSALATVGHGAYVWDIAAGAALMAKQGGEIRLHSGAPIDWQTIDLRTRIDEAFFGGHPAVTERLIPLFHRRPEPITHPGW
ncbi:MAG: inositol monophosphatase [Anaerolineae bacterium]|nr:inositol monophosphatase [Anaerolineae bacterium]